MVTLASSTTFTTATASATANSTATTVAALTTTFTPPASCADMHLTILASPGYQIWLNEPEPVPGTTIGDCYPPAFVSGYSSVYNASSSIAPMFSPLVCPSGWHTAKTFENGYIACCASGFLLHPPDTTVDTNRPAYGGTCYSNFVVSQTVNVTAYNNASITGTEEWVASSSADQAYGHVIDGFGVAEVAASTTAAAASNASAASASSTAAAASNSLSSGQIAGIVVGCILAFVLLIGLLVFFLRKRQAAKRRATSAGDAGAAAEVEGTDAFHEKSGEEPQKELPVSRSVGELDSPRVHELDAVAPVELDAGFKGAEVETPGVDKELERRQLALDDRGHHHHGDYSHGDEREGARTPPPAY